MYDYKATALNKMREEKLEMCFRKLPPVVKFNMEHLERVLFIINDPSMLLDFDCVQAIVDLKERLI